MTSQFARLGLFVAATLFLWSCPPPAPAGDFGAGTNPSSVAVGDVNGDGRLDLAVANNRSDNVSVLLGHGDGTFQTAVNYPVGSCSGPGQRSFPWSVAIGDLNGDQVPDLAVAASGCHIVSILLGNGDGTFQAGREFGAGVSPVSIAPGDFNGDQVPDLAVANFASGVASGVSVLLGNGDGTFRAAERYATGTEAQAVAVGDFNGDGRLDLAVANNGSDNVSVLLGNGDGTFQTAVNYAARRQPRSVAVGDFNGDGRPDLAVANFDLFNTDVDDVSVLMGKGDGTFFAAVNYPSGAGPMSWVHPISVGVADFNGDGKPDLTVANQDNSVSVLLGNGDGTFHVAGTFAAHIHPMSVAVGDFNGDELPDLAVANFDSNDVSVLLGNGDGTVQAASGANTLSVIKTGAGSGSVTSTPEGIDCGTSCTASYPFRATVILTAMPSTGSTFTGWSGSGAGGCPGTDACTVTITGTTFVTATFDVAPIFTLAVIRAGTGRGKVTGTPAGIDCGTSCSASHFGGTTVTLTATPDADSTFGGWSGGGCAGTDTCVVTMSAATTVTATFNVKSFTLMVSKIGTGSGTVTSGSAGVDCGATCSATYDSGTTVSLTASAADGSTFGGWSGGGCAGTDTCTVTMSAATTVTATFTRQQFTLTVAKAGVGSGTVTSGPAGVDCGATCSATYDSATTVTLTATPDSGSVVRGWRGCDTVSGATCTVTLNASRLIKAGFGVPPFTLVVGKAGTGSGTVTSDAGGIDCGATCSATYDSGTTVTLTATPDSGSIVRGWRGCDMVSGATCIVTLSASRSVTAGFAPRPFTLTIDKAGTGRGRVLSDPVGIYCGADCLASYRSGTVVTLTARAASVSTFVGWSGCDTVSETTCTVTMSAARSVTATFDLLDFCTATLAGDTAVTADLASPFW
jgi:hypothetical protein